MTPENTVYLDRAMVAELASLVARDGYEKGAAVSQADLLRGGDHSGMVVVSALGGPLSSRDYVHLGESGREFLVAVFDVTGLSQEERDGLAGEVFVQAEQSDLHPSVTAEMF